MKRLIILIAKVAEFGNPSTKNIGRQRYFIMYFEVFQVKWDMSVVKFFQKNCSSICMLYGEIYHAIYIR